MDDGDALVSDAAAAGSAFLQIDIEHTLGELSLRVAGALSAPWTVLFGPSGAGKTSLLRVLAGLTRPQMGRVSLHGQTLLDTAAGVWVPAARRGIGFVTQRPALFAHMDVTENVAFALTGMSRAERDGRVAEMLALFHAGSLARRMPAALSGGEKQRVALARALAPRPRLLLLDEPFTGLDSPLKASILQSLQACVAAGGMAALYVSHDVAEAFQTGAEVWTIDQGGITARGPAAVVLAAQRQALLQQLEPG